MVCRVVQVAFLLVFLGALFIYAAGNLGWFGAETDPLSGVFLIVLGMPWVLFPLDTFIDQAYWPVVAMVAPIVNLAIIRWLCRRSSA